jgi:hypothetical protein
VDQGRPFWVQVLFTVAVLAVSVWTGTRPTKAALDTRTLLHEGVSVQGLIASKGIPSGEGRLPQVSVCFFTDGTPGVPGDDDPAEQQRRWMQGELEATHRQLRAPFNFGYTASDPIRVPLGADFPGHGMFFGLVNGRFVWHEAYTGTVDVPTAYYNGIQSGDRVNVRYLARDPATLDIPAAWPQGRPQTNWAALFWSIFPVLNLARLVRARITS